VNAPVRAPGRLAALGGRPGVPPEARDLPWPVITDADRAAVLDVLTHGPLSANAAGEAVVPRLERRWAQRVGVAHCVAVSSGTAALQLALQALGVGPGDEVIVPALSFVASASAPALCGATPVFADISPDTFTLDPADVAARVTSRTVAVVVVHLHGLPADMDALAAVARRHGLALVEDAAQAHGARYSGRAAGALGDVAAFSLHPSKNLPACGEGGLVTTADQALAGRIERSRQFGEPTVPVGGRRDYLSAVVAGNAKLSPVQAAFADSQLDRFDEDGRRRAANVSRFLARLAALPGIGTPVVPAGRTHAWHILRLRFDADRAGLGGLRPDRLRDALRRLLRAEGVPMSRYQVQPLPSQEAFGAADAAGWPQTRAVLADSLTLQRRHLNPAADYFLQRCADAFEKVWDARDVVATIAGANR
jgi:dTDP-4-amino-4,6-dideoxygalactose transaminase